MTMFAVPGGMDARLTDALFSAPSFAADRMRPEHAAVHGSVPSKMD